MLVHYWVYPCSAPFRCRWRKATVWCLNNNTGLKPWRCWATTIIKGLILKCSPLAMDRDGDDTGHLRGSLAAVAVNQPTLFPTVKLHPSHTYIFKLRLALASGTHPWAIHGNTQTLESILSVSARNCIRPGWLPLTCGGSWFILRALTAMSNRQTCLNSSLEESRQLRLS